MQIDSNALLPLRSIRNAKKKIQKKNPSKFDRFLMDAAMPYPPGPCPAKYSRCIGA